MSDVNEKKGVGLFVEQQNVQNEKAEISINCDSVLGPKKLLKRLNAYAEKICCMKQ